MSLELPFSTSDKGGCAVQGAFLAGREQYGCSSLEEVPESCSPSPPQKKTVHQHLWRYKRVGRCSTEITFTEMFKSHKVMIKKQHLQLI